MNPMEKALWFIESHFASEIALEDIAKAGGVSRFHLTRAFGAATGRSIMRYVRGRRLTVAADALAKGAPDILSVALDAGYNSHEAFTRAFRDQFGVTPEMVPAQGDLKKIELVDPIKMDDTQLVNLNPPRFENGKRLLVAGLSGRYTCETSAGIPSQWQRFVPVPRQNSIPARDEVVSPYEHRRSKPGLSRKPGGDVLWSLVPASCEPMRHNILRKGAGVPSQNQGHQLRQPGRIDDAVHRVYRAK